MVLLHKAHIIKSDGNAVCIRVAANILSRGHGGINPDRYSLYVATHRNMHAWMK